MTLVGKGLVMYRKCLMFLGIIGCLFAGCSENSNSKGFASNSRASLKEQFSAFKRSRAAEKEQIKVSFSEYKEDEAQKASAVKKQWADFMKSREADQVNMKDTLERWYESQ
jgi:hypothetical protein